MVEVNRKTTPANMRWKLVDRDTGAKGAGDKARAAAEEAAAAEA